jgi:hypothetical protein
MNMLPPEDVVGRAVLGRSWWTARMAPLRLVPLKRCESICEEHAIEALVLIGGARGAEMRAWGFRT